MSEMLQKEENRCCCGISGGSGTVCQSERCQDIGFGQHFPKVFKNVSIERVPAEIQIVYSAAAEQLANALLDKRTVSKPRVRQGQCGDVWMLGNGRCKWQ